VAFVSGLAADVPANCTGVQGFNLGFGTSGAFTQLANGMQIFPGGVPIYRGGVLIGGVGVSGDGVDQDDMIAFLGLHEAGTLQGGAIGNAPVAARADTLAPAGSQLRYVNCPQAPFLDSSAEGVCAGKSTSPGRWLSAPPPPLKIKGCVLYRKGRIRAETAKIQQLTRYAEVRYPPQQPVEPGRRSPRVPVLRFEPTPCDPARLPDADPNALDEFPELPDRWRIVSLLGYPENLLDPYHGNNWLKGDRPAFGEDWFFNLGVVSDSVIEPRRFPVPVAAADGGDPGSLDTIGDGEQQFYAENLIVEAVLYQGNTVFQPPDWEFRFTPVLISSRVTTRHPETDPAEEPPHGAWSAAALFVDSTCATSPTTTTSTACASACSPSRSTSAASCSRTAPSAYLFGTRDSNRWQYNLAWFRRLEKTPTAASTT
jgi:hypothetical protein